jgi:hypothetical protein
MNFTDYPFIRIIPFSAFCSLGRFPRFPDDAHCTMSLSKLTVEEYDQSLMIFVSHCWLRGWSEAEGWCGRPHPDTVDGGKYKLCVDGIDKIMKSMASGMQNCYLWMDFGCIDQDGDPAGELKKLDKIVGVCDCLFTPIFDRDHEQWKLPTSTSDIYDDYLSSAWNGHPFSYLNRGWCRIEMFYAVNVPLLENSLDRKAKFTAGLAYHRSQGRRPHLLYGNKEVVERRNPIVLPPLQNSYYDKYSPIKGFVSVEKDKETISRLIKELEPFMKKAKVGYEGEYEDGKKHGKGKYTYAGGDVYEGEWKDDKYHGKGKCTYNNGAVYDGELNDDKKHGKGKYSYASGEVYEGEWKDDKYHGKGKFTYTSGNVYEGEFADFNYHGKGKLTFASGDVYEGEWKDDKKHGKGKYTYAGGNAYEGEWKDDKYHGKGKCTYNNGDVYEGEFADGKYHGKGKYSYVSGEAYEGEWKDDKYHAKGKFTYTSGDVYEGEWNNSNKRIICKIHFTNSIRLKIKELDFMTKVSSNNNERQIRQKVVTKGQTGRLQVVTLVKILADDGI